MRSITFLRKNELIRLSCLLFSLLFLVIPLCTACSPNNDSKTSSSYQQTSPVHVAATNNSLAADNTDSVEPYDVLENIYIGLPQDRASTLYLTCEQDMELELNPFAAESKNEINLYDFIYETLLYYDKDDFCYKSDILDDIILMDGRVSLQLREDVAFDDKSNLTTEDIELSYLLFIDSNLDLGELLRENVDSYEVQDNYVIDFILKKDDNSQTNFLHCLETLPILPASAWSDIYYSDMNYTDIDDLSELDTVPTIGSSLYSYSREDEFCLVLERKSYSKRFADHLSEDNFTKLPAYIVFCKFQADELANAALAHNDIDIFFYKSSTHPKREIKNKLEEYKQLTFWDDDISDDLYVLPYKETRHGITLNPLSESINNKGARSFIAAIALKLNNTQGLIYPDVENMIYSDSANQLTLLSTLPLQLTQGHNRYLPDNTEQDLLDYAEEAKWYKEEDSPWYHDSNGDVVEVKLYYPKGRSSVENTCEEIAKLMRGYGLKIETFAVSESNWQERWEKNNYDLIYRESAADESIAELITRLRHYPGLEESSEVENSKNYRAETGRKLLDDLSVAALKGHSIDKNLQNLNTFLIENNLFIPLAVGHESQGIGNSHYHSLEVMKYLFSFVASEQTQ